VENSMEEQFELTSPEFEEHDSDIPLAALMKEKAAISKDTFNERLYTRLRNEITAAIDNEAGRGNTIAQYSHQLANTQVHRNVLKKLQESFKAAGYLTAYSCEPALENEVIKARYTISWA